MNIVFVNISDNYVVSRGAGYVAGSILNTQHNLFYFDLINLSVDQIANKIIKGKYDMLLISSMTIMFYKAIELINKVKNKKNIPVLLGGVHATLLGSALLEQYKEIDYLCVGEGESMVVEFLNKFYSNEFKDIKNLVYRNDNEIISNSLRPVEDLSKLPKFPWHLFWKEAIVDKQTGFINVATSRGCPYNCSYCCNTIYLNKYKKTYLRYRPVEQAIEELQFLQKKYSPKGYFFGDEMIMSNGNHATSLLNTFKQKFNLSYGCMLRVEHVNEENVRLLKETGCVYVGLGVECGNEEFRIKYLHRNMSNSQIECAYSLLRNAGIETCSFNMIGYPFENDNQLTEDTIELNKKINPNKVQISIFYPFPGTKLYEHCINLNLIDEKKVKTQVDYYTESVFKGVMLADKLKEINKLFKNDSQDENKLIIFNKRIKSFLIRRYRMAYLNLFS